MRAEPHDDARSVAGVSGPPWTTPYAAIDVPGRPSRIARRSWSSVALSRKVWLTSDGAPSAAYPVASAPWHIAHSDA
jgi:hypothetical protein